MKRRSRYEGTVPERVQQALENATDWLDAADLSMRCAAGKAEVRAALAALEKTGEVEAREVSAFKNKTAGMRIDGTTMREWRKAQ